VVIPWCICIVGRLDARGVFRYSYRTVACGETGELTVAIVDDEVDMSKSITRLIRVQVCRTCMTD
jgi:hypothetical protein